MQKLILFLIIATSIVALSFTISSKKEDASNKNNYFVLTRKVEQLKPIILAAKDLKNEDQHHYGEFKVVICGKTVQDLVDPEKINSFLQLAQQNNVQLYACGFSLKKFNVTHEKLPEQVDVVENGILFGFRLQKQGYYNITL